MFGSQTQYIWKLICEHISLELKKHKSSCTLEIRDFNLIWHQSRKKARHSIVQIVGQRYGYINSFFILLIRRVIFYFIAMETPRVKPGSPAYMIKVLKWLYLNSYRSHKRNRITQLLYVRILFIIHTRQQQYV